MKDTEENPFIKGVLRVNRFNIREEQFFVEIKEARDWLTRSRQNDFEGTQQR